MKPKVICHMYVSLDGKIDGKYMEEEGCDISGQFYDDEIFRMGTSMASGRTTTQMYKAKGPNILQQFDGSNVPNGDFVVTAQHYNFVFDRTGKCFYDDNTYCYGGKTMQLCQVVGTSCDKRYLQYLRSKNIAYIVADGVANALHKIATLFGVETLVLTGGATLNGGFWQEDCIDQISLVVAPYVEGDTRYKQFLQLPTFRNTKFCFNKAVALGDGGVQLIFFKQGGKQ